MKQQEYYLRHPEQRKNNFFMKAVGDGMLQREDSRHDGYRRPLNTKEQLTLEEEL